ncbi:MAG: hypothetical protein RIT04_491 [Candidatus Parcubacteria bacterium]|jgi:phosphohistidine swiveling domain-containing protein
MTKIPKDLTAYTFSPEGGRATWQYMNYLLLLAYATPCAKWPFVWPYRDIAAAADFKNHSVKWYFVVTGNKVFTDFLNDILKRPKLLDEIIDFITTEKNAGVHQIRNLNLASCSDQELIQSIETYFTHSKHLLISAANIRRADRALLFSIRSKHPERADEILRMSSILTQSSFAMQEELALLKLATTVEQGSVKDEVIDAALQKIHDSYAWSVMGYYDEKPKGIEYYREKLAHMISLGAAKTLAEVETKITHDIAEREKFVATLDGDDQILAHIASQCAYIKDYFKSSINELEYVAEPVFDELAKRTGFMKTYIKDLTPDEILKVFDGNKVDQTLHDERVRHAVVVYGFGEIYDFAGKDADAFEATHLTIKNSTVREYKGRIACKGKVTGKVAIVKSHADFKKLQQGNILVVVNTSPDYVPIMQKAAAIVAEEGGLTAHVSVISREFGIPCIVGISHITDFLKDGDIVEVDADKGIVKVL